MKKYLLVFIFCCTLFSSIAQNYSQTTIRTPLGSIVPDTYVLTSGDMNSALKRAIKQGVLEQYNVEIVGDPTHAYNCHAYAWHTTEGGSNVWLGFYTSTAHHVYWTDQSYWEVTESNATKVVYEGNHSAVRTYNGEYVSKWGNGPLVKHPLNEVPQDYRPDKQKQFYKRFILTPQGLPQPILDYNHTYTASDTFIGVTFNGWTITLNNSYVVTGGTTSPTLTVKFTTLGQGTITANYTLPGGVPLTRSIAVRTYYVPSITHNGGYLTPGSTVTFTGLSTLSNIQWDWQVLMGGYEESFPSANSVTVRVDDYWKLTVRCRVINMQNGFFGDWATIDLPIYQYAPAPAPQDEEGEASTGLQES